MSFAPPAAAATAVLVCFLAIAPAGQETAAGGVAGKVQLTKRVRGVPLPSNAYQPRAVNRRDTEGGPEIKNVVVYLRDVTYRGGLQTTKTEMRQRNETFAPRVLAVTRGSTVDFPNADPFFHNVFSLSGAANFDLGRFPQGTSRSRLFNKPGLVRVYCHIHSHMSATILVLDHPYFVVPNLDGSYALSGVPAGRYTLVGWHERVGERRVRVRVERGKAATVSLSLPVGEPR